MSQDSAEDEVYYVNGINASTGAYIEDPLAPGEIAETARELTVGQRESDVRALQRRNEREEASLRPVFGIDVRDLSQTGWGLILAHDTCPSVVDALQELLDHRNQQAGDLFKVYAGDAGCLPGDTWESYRVRHHVNTGQADPEQMPYYLLLVGDPESVPYCFQFQADLVRAVGRIYFEDLEDYAAYAHSVVEAEKQPVQLPRRAVLFGTRNHDDRATLLSSRDLIEPLAEKLVATSAQHPFQVHRVAPADADRARLAQLLGGAETPALLFTATHGASFDADDPRYPQHQGALVTQDWPGPLQWEGGLTDEMYFSAADVAADAQLWGLIAVFFACFGAGTPALSDFYHIRELRPAERLQLADEALLAHLPRCLLGHRNGGALAVVGHVERAWTTSFKIPGVPSPRAQDLQAFVQLLHVLMLGYPVGAALEDMNSRYAQFATELMATLYPVTYQGMTYTEALKRKVAHLWTASNDARDYIIIGDPAVRLPVNKIGIALAERPVLSTSR